jgi:purine-cytosine permease-like protein
VRHGTPGMSGNHDFSTSRAGIVPRDQRRPMWHFIGLWTTLVAGFSFMVPGFVMYDGGYTLGAAAGASLLGYGIYVAYALAGSYLGAQTGQTLTLLTRAVFGRIGSWLVSLLVMIPALGWVGFQAGVLVRLWHGFYGWPQLAAITVALAAVMIFNNLFGFAGISLFARNLVTPVLVVWCALLVARGLAAGAAGRPALTGTHAGHLGYWVAVAAVIGFAMWGNEADVWRYGRPPHPMAAAHLPVRLLLVRAVHHRRLDDGQPGGRQRPLHLHRAVLHVRRVLAGLPDRHAQPVRH